MEKMQWFKFSPADWLMGKIQRVPDDVKVRFIGLVCLYWNKGCELSIEDAAIELDQINLDLLLSKKIIKQLDGYVKISFLDEQMTNVQSLSEARKEAANKRWANKTSASGMQLHDVALQKDADKIREDKIRKELYSKRLSEIDISDVELSLVDYFKIAKRFQEIFIKNLKDKNTPTTNQDKATFKNYVTPVRLMLENKECSIDDLRDVAIYLNSPEGEFWKKNILSTSKLREQITKLIMACRTKTKAQ